MSPIPFSPSTWMTSIPDKSIRLTALTIPGTHDSFCTASRLEFGIASLNKTFAACQHDSFTIPAQLESGIRLLDFRVGFDGRLSHGVARLDGVLYDEIKKVAEFLERNPGETVLVSVKWEFEEWRLGVKSTPEPEGEAGQIIQRLREVPGAKWWMEPTVPTLAEAAGKMVLLTRLSGSAKEGIRYSPGGEQLIDTPAPYRSQDHYDMGSAQGAGVRKWQDHILPFMLRALEHPQDGVLWFNFLSAYAGDGTPWGDNATPEDVARPVNELLRDFAMSLVGREGVKRLGLLLLDFPQQAVTEVLTRMNFPTV